MPSEQSTELFHRAMRNADNALGIGTREDVLDIEYGEQGKAQVAALAAIANDIHELLVQVERLKH